MDCTFKEMNDMTNIITRFNKSDDESEKHKLLYEFIKSIPESVEELDTKIYILEKFKTTPFYSPKLPTVSKKRSENRLEIKFTFFTIHFRHFDEIEFDVTTDIKKKKICIELAPSAIIYIKYKYIKYK